MTPYYFKTPFALSGDVTEIPREAQPSGAVSFEDGFGPDYSLVNSDPDSKKVPRDKHNWLLEAITENIKQYQEYGTPEWITAADNDGVDFSYSAGARVKYSGAVWVSLVDSNDSEPSTDPTKWRLAATIKQSIGNFAGVVSVTTTPYVLLASNIGKLHIFSGSAAAITMPAIAGVEDGEGFPMINLLSSNVVVTRDGSSTIAGVDGSTTTFTLPPYGWAAPAKSSSTVWTVPAFLQNNSISRKSSPAAQTVTDFTDAAYTFSHGLTVIPSIVTAKLKCLSTDAGYAVNDVVILSPFAYSNDGVSILIDSTNVVIRFPSGGISLANKGGGGTTALSSASKWELSIVAFA